MNKKDKQNKNVQPAAPRKKKSATLRIAVIGTVIGVFASAIVGLSVALYYAHVNIATHMTYQRQMDAVYSRAYYDLLDGASDLGITLRKISVSNSKEMQQSLLYDVWSASQLAEDNLGMFESQDDGILQAQKFVNQLGDFSHTLALRMSDGKPLTSEERQKLVKFGDMADLYLKSLEKVKDNMGDGIMFMENDSALDEFVSAFSSFCEPSFEYPEMIYDGPFSSALEDKQTLGLSGKDITEQEGATLVCKYLQGRKIDNLVCVGQGQGNIDTFNYTLNIDGQNSFVQLSKQGGMMVALNIQPDDDVEVARIEANKTFQQTALEFVQSLGFDNMRVVWSSSSHGESVINLAPVQDDIILYPDLVKVKVQERTGKVIGVDATHYAYNHHDRNLASPRITAEQAKSRISIPTHDVGRLALIPLRETREVLTYEFECEQNGTYFVYIDAMSGEEVNILYVIDDDLGARTI